MGDGILEYMQTELMISSSVVFAVVMLHQTSSQTEYVRIFDSDLPSQLQRSDFLMFQILILFSWVNRGRLAY